MKRLTHTPLGFIKYMQMSRNRLFIFVEGKQSDRYLYSQICRPICTERNVEYETIHAAEMSGHGGGKKQLLKFFGTLAQSGNLQSDFKGKKTTVLFFLDKDVDDILRARISSPHIVYTPTYDVEGLIFQNGDLVQASAALAGLDSKDVAAYLADTAAWLYACAECWKEWIVLCIFCRKHKLPLANFAALSRVNHDKNGSPIGLLDPGKFSIFLAKVRVATALNSEQFNRKYQCVRRLVEFIFARGKHAIIFKGKWYLPFLRGALLQAAAGRIYDKKAVDVGVVGTLTFGMDFSGAWARPFTEAAETVLSYIV